MKQSMITLLRRNGQPYNQTLQWTGRLQRFLVVMKAWSAPGRPMNVRPFCDDKF